MGLVSPGEASVTRTLTHFQGSGQFWIYEPDRFPDADTWDQSSGLVVTAEHGLVVLTSEYPGLITVTVDARDARRRRPTPPTGRWGASTGTTSSR